MFVREFVESVGAAVTSLACGAVEELCGTAAIRKQLKLDLSVLTL